MNKYFGIVKIFFLLLGMLYVLAFWRCTSDNNSSNEIEITDISFNSESYSLNIGDTLKLTAKLTPSNTTETISWKITDSNKASISYSGATCTITAVSAGNVSIIAYSGRVLKTVNITISEKKTEEIKEDDETGDDTEAPKITILNPPDGAAIKGNFLFAGTCSDDKGVTGVTVIVESLDNSDFKPFTLSASVVDSLTWSVDINKVSDSGYDLPDGKYKFTAVAQDGSGQSSDKNSRQFEIDNTAPVFVISKPGVVRSAYKSSSSLSVYGSCFTIEGMIADDHTISKMNLVIYDEEGNVINSEPYTEEEVSSTGGTSITIARYVDGGTAEINKRYNDIYSSGTLNPGETKVYSCTITLSDTAREYTTADSTGEGEGNTTSVVYFYDKIYETLLSKKKGAGLSVDDIKSVINGNATDTSLAGKGRTTVTVAQVKNALSSMATDTSSFEDNSLSFSINPNADPTYSIPGFELTYNDAGTAFVGNINKAMSKQTLSIIVSAGLEDAHIVSSSLKVWIKKISEANKSPLTKTELTTQIQTLVDTVKSLESDSETRDEDYATVEGWKLVKDNSFDSTFSTEIPGDNYVELNAYYAIVVTGYDQDGLYLSQNKLYGFFGNMMTN